MTNKEFQKFQEENFTSKEEREKLNEGLNHFLNFIKSLEENKNVTNSLILEKLNEFDKELLVILRKILNSTIIKIVDPNIFLATIFNIELNHIDILHKLEIIAEDSAINRTRIYKSSVLFKERFLILNLILVILIIVFCILILIVGYSPS